MASLSSKPYPFLAALLSGTLYLAFLSRNQVVDGVYYAWCGRYGHELAHPHHLLYNYWLRGIMLLTGGAGDNTILLFQAANAVAGAACIGLLVRILQRTGIPDRTAFWLGLAVAGSWGFARFATDNEAYVMPILFSLLALQSVLKKRWLWLAGLFSAVAILFHQVQIWWALPMLWLVWKKGELRLAIVFAAWHLLVPGIYLLVWRLYVDQPLLDFLAGEFKAGGVHTGWGWWTVVMTAVQAFRAFLQLHERMFMGLPYLWGQKIALALAVASLPFWYWLWLRFRKGRKADGSCARTAASDDLGSKELSVFGLQVIVLLLVFSLFSQGNAEFLAGLPFAIVFWLGRRLFSQRMAPALASTVWIWNFLFGLRVMAGYSLETDRKMARFAYQEQADAFLVMRKLEVDWWYAYLYGALPGHTRHWQWVRKGSEAEGGALLYDNQPVIWQTVLMERTSDRQIYQNLGMKGDDSVYPPLELPGYKNQLEPIYLKRAKGSNDESTIRVIKAFRVKANLTSPRR